jgi:hypothetical protein
MIQKGINPFEYSRVKSYSPIKTRKKLIRAKKRKTGHAGIKNKGI